MKKFFVLTLITFAFALAKLALPPKAVAVDKDVGLCYVTPMNQATVDMAFIADNNMITMPDYRSSLVLGVEKPDYIVITNSPIDDQYMYDKRDYCTTANQKATSQKSNYKSTDLGGLLTEYVSPRDGEQSRHIT